MADDAASVSQANVALAQSIMERFGRDMDGWYDNLHDDIVMEFPFGPTIGLPGRVEGKEACAGLFAAVVAGVQVQFSNIVVSPMADPNRVLVEYTGYSEPNGAVYNQTYITVQEFRDGKMILYREYMDTQVVTNAFGDVSALA